MYDAITATTITQAIVAGQTIQFAARGRFWYLTSGSAVVLEVWDGENRKLIDKMTLNAGRGIKVPSEYPAGYKLTLYSPTAQTVVLDVIDGEIIDNSFIVSSSSNVNTTPSKTTLTSDDGTPVTCPQNASTLVSAAATNIQRRWIRNSHATISVYLRSDASPVQSAIKLLPGDVVIVENQSALYVYNVAASGASVDIYVDVETTT